MSTGKRYKLYELLDNNATDKAACFPKKLPDLKMVKAKKGSGVSVAWGIVFILMRQPLLPHFRMCSEPVGGGLAPRRPWLVDDLQGTLSHILHPCQVGAGGREAGSTRLVCQGTENSTAGALGGGRRTRRAPDHSTRLGPSQGAP